MRKLVLTSLVLGALAALPACKKPDPNKFETHIEALQNPEKRAAGMAGLEKLVKSVASAGNDERLAEFGEKVVPVLAEVWTDAEEQRDKILLVLRDAGHPAGCVIWQQALDLDGSAESRAQTLLALEGIKKARAEACAEPVTKALEKLVKNPRADKGKEAGRVRLEMVDTLGELRAKSAVPVLIDVMKQTKEKQPVAVHRGAATALGLISDPAATDALLTVSFRVPDSPSTSDISNRSKIALVAIGDPAVPQVLKMLAGEHEEVNELAAKNGVDLLVVKQTAAGILGAMGAKGAVEDLVAFMPREDCGQEGAELDPADAGLRAFVAQALGFIGSEAAVEPLCSCIHATHNPGDMWEITQALGRIGGDKATPCLVDVVKTGEYDPEFLDNPEFRYQIRWEGARFAILAASPEQMGSVKEAMESQPQKVKENMAQWAPALEVAEECKADKACYLKVLGDASADWPAREKAAYELARLAPGDESVAVAISRAFKVRNPDARVSMALLPAWIMEGKPCAECVEAYESILKAEKGSMDATMQLPVLTVRNTIAKLRPDGVQTGQATGEGNKKAEDEAGPEAD